ncbi:YlxM family DNA-binding protein [Marininema halotolerans]|uniref:UPF0122 protein SAMN05444972_103155 n=1 Tax=Marininema halotolerans TaxID=1155944 RepID=A0A1I6QHD0_9BACL|nr:YlxM family DNA-binding protein [Marininema halotolerans]SFS51883.1 hypothetical protein SAMN05444972_103155 [Marininema halotolerans]
MLEKTTRVNLLYDFYSPLLTKKQQQILEFYFHEDWSMGEIADHLGISRQAVFEGLKRAQGALEEWEEALRLLQRHLKRREIADRIISEMQNSPQSERVKSMVQELLDLD